jgi:hypothetical protein
MIPAQTSRPFKIAMVLKDHYLENIASEEFLRK